MLFRAASFQVLIAVSLAGLAGLSASAAGPGPRILLGPERLAELKQAIAEKKEPTYTAWLEVEERAEAALDDDPDVPDVWYVPGYYGNAKGHLKAKAGLKKDGTDAYALALAWQMTGQEKYARASAEIVNAWAGLKKARKGADSKLSFSYHFPPLIFAADLLRGSKDFPPQRDKAFADFLENTALGMNTMDRGNNWGNWGLVLVSAIGAYRQDAALIDQAVGRWKKLIDTQVGPDGVLHHEVKRNGGRSGLWYSNFSLLPQTIAAEVLRVAGHDVYDYKSPRGRTLRMAYEKLAPWTLKPETFPYWRKDPARLHGHDYVSYFELLAPRWPNRAAAAMLKRNRPLSARHGLAFLTFTHGQDLDQAD